MENSISIDIKPQNNINNWKTDEFLNNALEKCDLNGKKNNYESFEKNYLNRLEEKNCKINNIGIMIEAKKPKLEPWHDKIKESLSELLKINKSQIGLTFTSGEDLTDFGKGLGIQCYCVVSLD